MTPKLTWVPTWNYHLSRHDADRWHAPLADQTKKLIVAGNGNWTGAYTITVKAFGEELEALADDPDQAKWIAELLFDGLQNRWREEHGVKRT